MQISTSRAVGLERQFLIGAQFITTRCAGRFDSVMGFYRWVNGDEIILNKMESDGNNFLAHS